VNVVSVRTFAQMIGRHPPSAQMYLDDWVTSGHAEKLDDDHYRLTYRGLDAALAFASLEAIESDPTPAHRQDPPEDRREHGLESTFRAGCRCDRCTGAQLRRNGDRRHVARPVATDVVTYVDPTRIVPKAERRPGGHKHGTTSAFRLGRCRCPLCVEAHDRWAKERAEVERSKPVVSKKAASRQLGERRQQKIERRRARVAELRADGKTHLEIAAELGITAKTVYLDCRRLGLTGRPGRRKQQAVAA
jgi:hypothetical protein